MSWKLQILGRASVVDARGEAVRFRSRSALALLVYLGLHDQTVSRGEVESALWPESDGDRRSQNFRRALADLRDVLESDAARGTVIYTARDSIGLVPEGLYVDASEFRSLVESGLKSGDEGSLTEAVDLYQGAVWPDASDYWIFGYRDELEELYAQLVDELSERLVQRRKLREAVRLGRAAVLRAPMREEVHTSLVRAYSASGQTVEAIRQFEVLEKMLDDNWGEAPSARARAALDTVAVQVDAGSLGGLVVQAGYSARTPNPNSEHYVPRPADAEASKAILAYESIVLLHGPRQVGKTSMLARCMATSRQKEHKVVLSDFQSLGASQIADQERLYRTLADQLVRALDVDINPAALWSAWLGPNTNLDNLVRAALTRVEGPVLWAMDEADRLFGHECGNDFFGLVRSWHNRRALDPDGPWARLTIVIAYATEAHLFITDLNQSPFNVGVRLRLEDFTFGQVEQLNLSLGCPATAGELERVFRLTHGQPFLSRRALDFLANNGAIEELETTCLSDQGPFGEHLRRLGQVVVKDESVLAAVYDILRGAPLEDRVRSRLLSGGVARQLDTRLEFRVPIYGPYLQSILVN